MAKRTKTSSDPAGGEVPSFEDSLAALQQIVADLEDGSIGLEESLKRFETGVGLLRTCHRVLERAEQKIEIITGTDADGNPVVAPFDAAATYEQADPAAGRRRAARKREANADPAPGVEREAEETLDEGGLF